MVKTIPYSFPVASEFRSAWGRYDVLRTHQAAVFYEMLIGRRNTEILSTGTLVENGCLASDDLPFNKDSKSAVILRVVADLSIWGLR